MLQTLDTILLPAIALIFTVYILGCLFFGKHKGFTSIKNIFGVVVFLVLLKMIF